MGKPLFKIGKKTHRRDTKLFAISWVDKSESIRQVRCDLGLLDLGFITGWI